MPSHRAAIVHSALILGTLAAASPSRATEPADRQKTQFVIVSFDGAHDNALWARSLDMGKRNGARFTYFLSCTFLMTRETGGKTYHAPGHKAGRSNVGFAPDTADVEARLGHIWQAHLDGHEIASHACGHFDGGEWTRAEWNGEFDAFGKALRNAWRANGAGAAEPAGWQTFVVNDIKGFRAPYLSQNAAMTGALSDHGFAYDASLVSKGPAEPVTDQGLARFALPLIPEGPSARPVIAMDYNLFIRHSTGIENSRDSALFEARTYRAFMQAFEGQYAAERVPLQLGFHFVEMNGGAYWRALDRFLSDVCSREGVACVSYSDWLDRNIRIKQSAY